MKDSREQFEAWYKEHINADGPFMGCGKLMRSEHAMFGLMCWQASRESVPDFHNWLEDAKPLEGYGSHIEDGNFDHADVVRLMELAYNSGAGRV